MYGRNDRKNKAWSGVILAVLLIGPALLNSLSSQKGSYSPYLFLLLLPLLAGAGALYLGKKAKTQMTRGLKSRIEKAAEKLSSFSEDAQEEKWRGPATKKSDSVCSEHLAEDSFEHDRILRLNQLDVFLKNGIIDKKEYALLRQRYEKLTERLQ